MPNDPGYGHIAFSVEDVPRAVRELVDHGETLLGETASTSVTGIGELEVIYVRDRDDNIIELQAWRTQGPGDSPLARYADVACGAVMHRPPSGSRGPART